MAFHGEPKCKSRHVKAAINTAISKNAVRFSRGWYPWVLKTTGMDETKASPVLVSEKKT